MRPKKKPKLRLPLLAAEARCLCVRLAKLPSMASVAAAFEVAFCDLDGLLARLVNGFVRGVGGSDGRLHHGDSRFRTCRCVLRDVFDERLHLAVLLFVLLFSDAGEFTLRCRDDFIQVAAIRQRLFRPPAARGLPAAPAIPARQLHRQHALRVFLAFSQRRLHNLQVQLNQLFDAFKCFGRPDRTAFQSAGFLGPRGRITRGSQQSQRFTLPG